MKKYILLLLFFLGAIDIYAQSQLFDDFTYKMPKKNAYSLLKKNKKKFNSLDLGPTNTFILRRGSLVFEEDELIHITIWSKSNLNLNKTKKLLNISKNHLESQGFELVYAQPDWQNPLTKQRDKPYMRLVHKEKNVLTELEPRGQGETFNIFLSYYQLNWFHQMVKAL
ncbi:MAG: hypothetical protein VX714_03515 [Bacteroidota bacterium]|nr:hypothetical protein [Bacteroidota bacterium]